MKKTAIAIIAALTSTLSAAAAYQPPEVIIQHMSTAFANQGMCAVRFSLETTTGEGDAGTVNIDLTFLDKQKKEVARGRITAELYDSTAGRYHEDIVEGEDMCLDNETTVVVRRARSEYQGRKYDLLKLKKMRVSEFRPYKIIFAR